MKQELKNRLMQMVAEEQKNPVDAAMLAQLRSLVGEDPLVLAEQLSPQGRNALNTFLREIRDFMLQEVMRGDYGASIVADSAIVMAFEAGFRWAAKYPLGVKKSGAG